MNRLIGGAERDVAGLDADLEGVGGEDVGHVLRAAGGQDADDVEVGEGDDQAEQHGDAMMLRIIGRVTKNSFCSRAGAVDRRRLIELLGHRFQRRQVHDHEERRAEPDIDGDGAEPRVQPVPSQGTVGSRAGSAPS